MTPDGKKRCEEILTAAVSLAMSHGYDRMTRDQVAALAGCSTGLVNNYYSTMTQLRRAVVRHAIKNELLPIVAQALVAKDPHIRKAPDDLRRRALDGLMTA